MYKINRNDIGNVTSFNFGSEDRKVYGDEEYGYSVQLHINDIWNLNICDFLNSTEVQINDINNLLPWDNKLDLLLLFHKTNNSVEFQLYISAAIGLWRFPINYTIYIDEFRFLVNQYFKKYNCSKVSSDDQTYGFDIKWSEENLDTTFNESLSSLIDRLIEISGETEINLFKEIPEIHNITDEKEFVLSIVIPLFRKLGFQKVQYYHGTKEFGKDIILSFKNLLNIEEYWAIQVKNKSISGNSQSELNTIINQIEDAFQNPFEDIYSNERQYISKLIIILNGKLKGNAKEKIINRLSNSVEKSNVTFLDRDMIEEYIHQINKK